MMGRENKKDVVAALHREQIMKAAEKLFSEKGQPIYRCEAMYRTK